MDEFLVAIMSGCAFLAYTLVVNIFVRSSYRVQARWIILGGIVVLIVLYLLKRGWDKRQWRKKGLDPESYMFYQKYTSTGNKISYIFTYLLQDFIYVVKKTNKSYNFSKGLFRYDDSLGEYYIDCRIVWYSYIRFNILKNRLSLHKLNIFSLEKCNQMILELYPEQAELYKRVKESWIENNNQVPLTSKISRSSLYEIEGAMELDRLIRLNLFDMEQSRRFMMVNTPRYHTMIQKTEKRKDDSREIKNFSVDMNDSNRMK